MSQAVTKPLRSMRVADPKCERCRHDFTAIYIDFRDQPSEALCRTCCARIYPDVAIMAGFINKPE